MSGLKIFFVDREIYLVLIKLYLVAIPRLHQLARFNEWQPELLENIGILRSKDQKCHRACCHLEAWFAVADVFAGNTIPDLYFSSLLKLNALVSIVTYSIL